ncbi:hypothetical protein QE152_g34971 [Popillia japonica]|uniref:Integrase catalytic domain-containing protein n=1 Tax=Popillia japonica TaxID=7064 RepID=A0AAW1IT27_POPJA
MAQDIENEIRKCKICEKFQRRNIKEPMKPHKIPGLPFEKIAITDILQFGGKFYLMNLKEFLTKWLDILMLKGKTSDDVIDEFKRIFDRHGIPKEIVSDNMPFNSVKCRTFAEKWDIKITTSSPHYPKSNGLAEKAVGIAKNFLRKSNDLQLTLLEYRNTPITELGLSPAQVLMSRSLRTKIPVCDRKLKPKKNNNNQIRQKIQEKRKREKDYYDRNAKSRAEFKREDVVLRKEKEWVPAKIEEKLDYPRSYLVKDEEGIDKKLDEAGKKGEEQVDDRDQEEVNKEIANQRQEIEIENRGEREKREVNKEIANQRQEIEIENRGEREKRERKLPSRFKDYKLY